MRRRVVVSGIGLISPLGDTPEQVFEAAMSGRSAIRLWNDDPLATAQESASVSAPAVVARAPFDVTRFFAKLQLTGVDRVSQMAVAAGQLAKQDAGLEILDVDAGLYVGTSMGGAAALEQSYANFFDGRRIPPLTIPSFIPNASASHLAMREKLHGPVLTYSMACASSAIAIAEAAKAISRGDITMALAGGSEALLVPGVLSAWQSLRTLADPGDDPARACRPFSSTRSGLVLGEGAIFLLMETLESAQARGARIYAEIAGIGFSCDATHLTKPDAAGQVRAIKAALRDSALSPSDIGYCNAHGTATLVGDLVECDALAQVWGSNLSRLQVSSTKSIHGHLLGAGGALEAALTVMALSNRAVPPNMHCADQDPNCPVNLIREPHHQAPHLTAAISNSFAFGGSNVVLVFRNHA